MKEYLAKHAEKGKWVNIVVIDHCVLVNTVYAVCFKPVNKLTSTEKQYIKLIPVQELVYGR